MAFARGCTGPRYRPVLDIVEVVFDRRSIFSAVSVSPAPAVDLRPAGYARLHLWRQITVDGIVDRCNVFQPRHGSRAGRTNERQVALEDTLKSCGNSSRLVLRINFPTRVTRRSSF